MPIERCLDQRSLADQCATACDIHSRVFAEIFEELEVSRLGCLEPFMLSAFIIMHACVRRLHSHQQRDQQRCQSGHLGKFEVWF